MASALSSTKLCRASSSRTNRPSAAQPQPNFQPRHVNRCFRRWRGWSQNYTAFIRDISDIRGQKITSEEMLAAKQHFDSLWHREEETARNGDPSDNPQPRFLK